LLPPFLVLSSFSSPSLERGKVLVEGKLEGFEPVKAGWELDEVNQSTFYCSYRNN